MIDGARPVRAAPPRAPRVASALVIVGLVALCVSLWLLRRASEPQQDPAPAASTETATVPPAAILSPPPPTPELPALPRAPDLRGNDTADPCEPPFEAEPPTGDESVTADGVTVAWQPGAVRTGPYDVALPPLAVAHLVKGLLAEAAAATGTLPRERMVVIVYASRDSLHTATRAPRWADGVYDGGAVRVAAEPSADLGVALPALRHELMHAQLHAAVGCMPAWLNEGLAMYFAGTPPVRSWLAMLREPDNFDLETLQVPAFSSLPDDRAHRAYAESLAMIVYLVERSGELGFKTAVQTLREAHDASRAGLDLWDRLYPGIDHRALLDTLARKLFGLSPGSELAALLRGTICCYGVRGLGELGCRSGTRRPERKLPWIDASRAPRALCDPTW